MREPGDREVQRRITAFWSRVAPGLRGTRRQHGRVRLRRVTAIHLAPAMLDELVASAGAGGPAVERRPDLDLGGGVPYLITATRP